jgi:RHS repeat-associated protein
VAREDCGKTIRVVFSFIECVFRRRPNGTWELDEDLLDPTVGPDADTISLSVTGATITFNLSGQTWQFHGFQQSDNPPGSFDSSAEFDATYDEQGQLVGVNRPAGYDGDGPQDGLAYDYVAGGPNEGLTSTVTLSRTIDGNPVTINRVEFKYYDSVGDYGEVGDLWAKQTLVWDADAGSAGEWVRLEGALVANTKNFAEQWGLDPTGNWDSFKQDTDGSGWDLERNRDHNEVNEITDIDETTGPSWATPSHDKVGNLIEIPQPDDPTATFTLTYDAWNRLVAVEEGANTVAQYEYDGRSYRTVKKTYSGGQLDETRHFYYSGDWQTLEERVDTATTAERQYVWGRRYVDDLVLRDRNADGNPQTGDRGKSGSGLEQRLYALQDANFNVAAMADATGTVQERYLYDPFGRVTIYDGTWSATRPQSSYDAVHLFTGRRRDTETGLYDYRVRPYHPLLGRFPGRDPVGYEAGMNLYAYVGNRPLDSLDPNGLRPCWPILVNGRRRRFWRIPRPAWPPTFDRLGGYIYYRAYDGGVEIDSVARVGPESGEDQRVSSGQSGWHDHGGKRCRRSTRRTPSLPPQSGRRQLGLRVCARARRSCFRVGSGRMKMVTSQEFGRPRMNSPRLHKVWFVTMLAATAWPAQGGAGHAQRGEEFGAERVAVAKLRELGGRLTFENRRAISVDLTRAKDFSVAIDHRAHLPSIVQLDLAGEADRQGEMTVAKDDDGQIVRVIVRNGQLDAEMAAKLRGMERLESIELYDVTPTAEAWRGLEGLASLRLLKIRATAVDFAKLQRLAAERPELTIDYPWPVMLSISQQALAIQLPPVRVVCEGMWPLAGLGEEFSVDLAGTARHVAKVPLPDPRAGVTHDPLALIEPKWYHTENGAVCIVHPKKSFLISTDLSTVTIGDRSFPIVDRGRTVFIDEHGRPELHDFQLDYVHEKVLFVGGEEVSSGQAAEQKADAGGGAGTADQGILKGVQERITTQYHGAQTRSLTYMSGFHRDGWVFSLSPDVPWASGDVAGAATFPTGGSGTFWYYPDIGLNLLFKHPLTAATHTRGAHGQARFRTTRLRGNRWKLFDEGMRPPPLQVQAIFSADEGDLVFNLGEFSPEGDFRVDGKGRHVTVGDKTVELSAGVATTIFLSGDKSEGERLRLERVETEER